MRAATGLALLTLVGAGGGAEPAGPVPACDPAEWHVAIDVGHSPGGGALSARGVREWDFNLRQAREIEAALHAAGFTGSFLLDPGGRGLPLKTRPALAAEQGADLLLSIHHDAVQEHLLERWTVDGEERHFSDRHQGFSLFVSARSAQPERSLALADALGAELMAQGLVPTWYHALDIPGERRRVLTEHGVYAGDGLAVLRLASVPAVLLECGMLVHRDEEWMLDDPAYRALISEAVVCAARRICQAGGAPS